MIGVVRMRQLVGGLLLAMSVFIGCGVETPSQVDTAVTHAGEREPAHQDDPTPATAASELPIEPVPDCDALARRAERDDVELSLVPLLCPGLTLDHSQLRRVLLSVGSAAAAADVIASLDRDAELQGLARLASLDRSSQPPPSELPDPATALLTPIDDRILAAVELAYAQLRRDDLDETTRTLAHAFLARVYMQALQTLGLPPGRPLPPFARLLAGPALFHARSFCRFYWQRRIGGLERLFAETELELLTLLIDLDNTPHAGDTALLAVERQQVRMYLEREGPRSRIAKRAQQRPETIGLGVELLLPFVHEIERLFDHRFIDLALERAMRRGAEPGGYGIDELAALVTEQLRERDLREYERRLARRVERARKSTPSSRHAGSRELEPELPVEWPSAARVAEDAHAWLAIAHGRGPDFVRKHARARAIALLSWRGDAVRELLAAGPEDAVVRGEEALLFALLDSTGEDDLAGLRLRVTAEQPRGDAPVLRDARVRRRFALATRDALLHPR